jgi:hypothetical protein
MQVMIELARYSSRQVATIVLRLRRCLARTVAAPLTRRTALASLSPQAGRGVLLGVEVLEPA